MTSKPSRATAPAVPGKAAMQQPPDDLKQIRGVGPAAERRLHQAGIRTFVQLAGSSPEKIATSAPGLLAKRIASENWIGQARQLAHRRRNQMAKPAKDHAPAIKPPQRATFTLELLLDNAHKRQYMHCRHIQSGDRETWTSWEELETQLVGFVVGHAGRRLRLAAASASPALPERVQPLLVVAEPAPAATRAAPLATRPPPSLLPEAGPAAEPSLVAEAADEARIVERELPPLQVAALEVPPGEVETQEPGPGEHEAVETPASDAHPRPAGVEIRAEEPGGELSGAFQLCDKAVIVTDDDRPRQMLPADAPFRVRFSLDLTGIEGPRDASLDCLTTIYAKRLGGGGRQIIGERCTEIKLSDRVTVEVEGLRLPSGLYRLEAMASLDLLSPRHQPRHGLTAMLKVGLLQVY